MWSTTLSSHLSLPWSTSVAMAATVNALPVGAGGKDRVFVDFGGLALPAHAPAM
jgi:hypothetical protein